MSSATSFYDFEPVDSTYNHDTHSPPKAPLLPRRKAPRLTNTLSQKRASPSPLASLKGKVVLVVNTASKCGFTPQFEGLEKLYKKLKERYPDDFTILGFPCNQFNSQDPGSNDDIQSFCQLNYGVTFPVLGKLDVNGENAAPVFAWMKEQMPGIMGIKYVKWNFEKFLIGADGKVVSRWATITKPEALEEPIVKEIEKAKKTKAEL